MPCWTINNVETDFSNAIEGDTFALAVKSLGLSWDGSQFRGSVTVDGITETVWGRITDRTLLVQSSRFGTEQNAKVGTMIRRAYSEQIIRKQAARYGWTVQQQAGGKLALLRR